MRGPCLERSRAGVQSHVATCEAAEVFKESSDFITLWVADFGGRVEEAEEGRSSETPSGVLRRCAEAAGLRPWAPEEAASGCFRENSGKYLGFGAQQTRVQILTLPLTGL